MTDEGEARFLAAARAALDDSARALDVRTVARLRAARLKALDSIRPRPLQLLPWLAPAGVFAVSALALVLLTAGGGTVPGTAEAALADLEMLAAPDRFDLYQDLDFYEWLEEYGAREIG
jgi:hypothetical protein